MIYVNHAEKNSLCSLRSKVSSVLDTQISQIPTAWFYRETYQRTFYEIAEKYDFEILAMELMPDHVHLFVSAAPKRAPRKIVSIFKVITSKIIFEEFPQVKKKLWGGHLWSAGYYAASVGDKVTAEMVKKYIRHQRQISFDG